MIMQTETQTPTIQQRVREFNYELKRVVSKGYVTRTEVISSSDYGEKSKGAELFLDIAISKQQIRHIVHYIISTYNLDAIFHTKSHSIRVWHRNAK